MNGQIQVDRMYKKGKLVTKEESGTESIDVPKFAEGVAIAEVGCVASLTLNLGNYESVKISVSCNLPCYITELDEAYETAKNFVDDHLQDQATEIKAHRKRG